MKIQEYIKVLFDVQINTQVAHWQTTGEGSYATHKALEEIYLGIVDLRDTLVESSQYKDIIRGYKSPILNENMDMIAFLEGVIEDSNTFREGQEPYIQQIVDSIIEFINKGIYKLRFLK
jgi:hypothetical protein